jgi:hypothetical protein
MSKGHTVLTCVPKTDIFRPKADRYTAFVSLNKLIVKGKI